ncbi:MAG: hypothetical protein ABI395_07020 [Sphingobium sp.]
MSYPTLTIATCRSEAECLIEIARMLLDRPEEEMVVNYLDHAIAALRMIALDPRLPDCALR